MTMIKTKTETETKIKIQLTAEDKRYFWQRHIQKWKERGITQADYCREHELKATAFTYWKGKLGQESASISDTSSISLVPVAMKVNFQPAPQPLVPKPLVVVVDSHFRIEVAGDFESVTLVKLVSTLRQA